MSQELQTQQNTQIGLTSLQGFELAQRAAKMLSSSTLVPKEYQGPQGMANCCIALNMAHRMGADPLMVMQNLVPIHGRPAWSSQFLIATFNTCGRFSSIKFDFFGEQNSDEWGCRAYCTELSTQEKLYGPAVTIGISKAEGWYSRNGSKWKTMPEQMLRYRAASWFIRTTAPEISMGLMTQEEAIDITDFHRVDETANNKPTRRGRPIDDIIGNEPDPPEQPPIEGETINTETGEILPPDDEYTDLRIAISECQTMSDIVRLLNEMPAKAKAALKPELTARQNEIKAAQIDQ